MKRRLLVYAHYFYPDVASTGQILTDLCEGLKNDFEITVIAAVPSYGGKVEEKYKVQRLYFEKHKNINMVRVRVPEFTKSNKKSRIFNILAYLINSIIATFKVGEQDVVFSISQPPILGGLLGVMGKKIKKAKFIYNIQDFNPDQTEAVGYVKSKFVLKFAKFLDKYNCKKADTIVVVGTDMKETLLNRFVNKEVPVHKVINNWTDEKSVYPLSKEHERVRDFKSKYDLENKIVIMHSGNIGLYYDLENIIKVFGTYKDNENVVFCFVGDGTFKKTLEQYVVDNKINNIKFIPYQDKKDLIYSLNSADVHLVTNAKSIKGISVPSKIYGVLASGKYVLGVLEKDSTARNIIEEAGCGLCVEPMDYDGLKEKIDLILKMNNIRVEDIKMKEIITDDLNIIEINNKDIELKEIDIKGLKGREFLVKNLSKDVSVGKYRDVIMNI